MTTRARINERWRYLRDLLIHQLEAVEAGALQIRSNDLDVSLPAIALLKREIGVFDALIAEDRATDL